MDLNTVATYRAARTRADLALAPGERFLGGGTWLFSEPQLTTTGLVDLTTMGWPALERLDGGLRVAATCPIAELVAFVAPDEWRARPLFGQCANALLASFKIWNAATVGGNVCRAFAAGAMVSLGVALDASALVWRPDGGDYHVPVEQLITGNGTNALAPGEILRALDIPTHALRARTAFRKIALAELGRSGAVLTGRVDADGSTVFTVTAATARPTVLRYPDRPDAATLWADVAGAEGYYTDPLGSADWRRQVSGVLSEQIRLELGTSP